MLSFINENCKNRQSLSGKEGGLIKFHGGELVKLTAGNIFLLGIVLALGTTQPLQAQLESACEDHCKINTNAAGIVNVPLNPTAALATVGWGGVAGVGYNFNK